MDTKLGSADVIARRIERALDRFYPTGLVQLVRLSGLLVYRASVEEVALVNPEYKYRAAGPFAADLPRQVI